MISAIVLDLCMVPLKKFCVTNQDENKMFLWYIGKIHWASFIELNSFKKKNTMMFTTI